MFNTSMIKVVEKRNAVERREAVENLIDRYNRRLFNIPTQARLAVRKDSSKTVPGQTRQMKGDFVEDLTKDMVRLVCQNLDIDKNRLSFKTDPVVVGIENENYIFEKVDNIHVAERIVDNLDDYVHELVTDAPIYIDDKLVMNIECKSFTEAAMLKRILFDSQLLKSQHPAADCVLLQLENALGGDYGKDTVPTYGSRSAHALMSVSPIKLHILTLMLGNRNGKKRVEDIRKPIDLKKMEQSLDKLKTLIKNKVIV